MTANRAVPDQAGWGAAAGPEAAAGAAALVPDLAAGPEVAAGPEFAGAPVRGSRGRHAGPASAGPPGGLAPGALLAGHTRRGLAACRDYPLATGGGLIIVAVVVFCFLGPLFYHSDLTHVFLSQANLSPRAGHPLGTDADGADELGTLMKGGQVSLEVAAAAGVLAAVLGSLWGAVAGYLGGAADAVMMRIADAAIAIPAIVLLLLLMSIYRPSTAMLVLVIAGTSWLSTARLVRAEALTLRVREYVQAARVMGSSGLRVIVRHIAPNAMGTIVVNVSFQIANSILILATLSWLGLGVQFPSVDWGDMIGAATQTISEGYWWQIVCPGVAIIAVIVAFTMLGDGLRDAFSAAGYDARPDAPADAVGQAAGPAVSR
ncbi:MAG TPA: ABC transporter permease [Streptosporangiaceae bacterium]|nr:ABC transporter permease [Streptosporangiaceae bacterium]